MPHGIAFSVIPSLCLHHTHSAFLSLLCMLVHECHTCRYAQSQHPRFPLAPTFTHCLACTVLFYFVSTKQIPIQHAPVTHMLSVVASHLPATTASTHYETPLFLPPSHIYRALLFIRSHFCLWFAHTCFSLSHIFSQTCIH